MSFFGLLFQAFNVLNSVIGVINQLQQEAERQKQELKNTIGKDVDIEVVVINDGGKWKAGLLVDLEGNIEEQIAEILRNFGINIRVLKCN